MHAVRPFVNQDRHRRIGSGIWNELRHLLHNERISYKETDALGRLAPESSHVRMAHTRPELRENLIEW